MRLLLRFCASCAFLRPSLLVLFAAFAGHLAAQPANVQADPTTGALFRPAAATFISGNSLLTTSAAAAAYQPLDADLTSWAAVVRAGGFDTFVATPSSANLATLVTGETGSGALVFGTSPTFTTPTLGAATATSITGATDLTLAGGSTGASLVLGATTTGNAVVNVSASSPTDPQTSVFRVATGTRQLNLGINSATGYAYIQSINTGIAWAPLVLQGGAGGNVLIGTTTDMTGTGGLKIAGTTSATSSTAGAFLVGNGTAATNVAIGGGNINAGGIISATTGGFKGANYLNSTGLTGNIITGDTNQDFYINGSIKMSLSAATTSLSSTTPSTGVGTGALQVAGGIYAGAASYFGGSLGGANQRVATFANTGGNGFIEIGGSASKAAQILATGSGVMALYTNATAGTIGTLALTLSETQAATFAGAVTIAGTVIHTLSATPASASATGTVGTMSWDANYIYICTATNTWKRVAIATW
jgi:hypothetical protein